MIHDSTPFNSSDYGVMREIDDYESWSDSEHLTSGGGMMGDDLSDFTPTKYEVLPMSSGDSFLSSSAESSFASFVPERKSKNDSSRFKMLAAVGLISGGLYTVLRSLGRRK